MPKILEPSLLSFNLEKINEEFTTAKQIGISTIHYDVIDPNYANTPQLFYLEYLLPIAEKGFKINVHIMSVNPLAYVTDFLDFNKLNTLTFQHEMLSESDAINIINFIKGKGIKAGIAIKPETTIATIKPIIRCCDIVTFMFVQPGKGGQAFMEELISKLEELYEFRKEEKLKFLIEVDGGINKKNISLIRDKADYFVIGTGYTNLDFYEKKALTMLVEGKVRKEKNKNGKSKRKS